MSDNVLIAIVFAITVLVLVGSLIFVSRKFQKDKGNSINDDAKFIKITTSAATEPESAIPASTEQTDYSVIRIDSLRFYLPEKLLRIRLGNNIAPLHEYVTNIQKVTDQYWSKNDYGTAKGLLITFGVRSSFDEYKKWLDIIKIDKSPPAVLYTAVDAHTVCESKFWCDAVEGSIDKNVLLAFEHRLAAITPVAVKYGPVAFAINICFAECTVEKFPVLPSGWTDCLKGFSKPVMIPDELFAEIWPMIRKNGIARSKGIRKTAALIGDNGAHARIFYHDIETQEGLVSCWSFVTVGFAALGQKEIVFTLRRLPGEPLDPCPDEPLKLLNMICSMASAGKYVDIGSFTQFRERKFYGRHLAYVRAIDLPDVIMPDDGLHAILIIEQELELLKQCGVTRLMALLGQESRFYPCPPWSGRTRVRLLPKEIWETSIVLHTCSPWCECSVFLLQQATSHQVVAFDSTNIC